MRAFPLGARERVRRFATLGIRFWDAAFDRPVAGGLVVHAWLRGGAYPPVRAVRSSAGVYSFHRLPCRREAEFPGAAEQPEELGPELEYTVVVDDRTGSFLPTAFSVTLPLGYRGEFLSGSAASLPGGPGRAYLYSAPSRPIPPGSAAIRADLEDPDRGGPAAWAVLRATVEGREAVGVADREGRVLLLTPMPEVESLGRGSPPGSGQGPVAGVGWPVTLEVDYQPDALRYPLAGAAGLPADWVDRPSLKSVLDEQDAALVTLEEGDPPVTDWEEELEYGEPLQLRTSDARGDGLSSVWVHAGASIP